MNPWNTPPKYTRENTAQHEIRGLARPQEKAQWRPDHFRLKSGDHAGNRYGVDLDAAISASGTRPALVIHVETKRCKSRGTTQVIEKDVLDRETYDAAIAMGLSVEQATTYATRAVK
jgi:hypothetical protein